VFRCPYQFLLSKLGVKEKREESPSLWEGRWLHEILEAFYTGVLQKKNVCDPLPQILTLAFDEIAPYATKRLDVITDLCLPDFVKGSPFHLHIKHFAWPRFAEHWSQFFEESGEGLWTFSTSHSLKEYPLVGRGLPIDVNEHSSLLGTLDSLDVHKQASVLVDYKRKHVDSVSDVVKGVSPQLPLYALALAQNRFQEDEGFLDSCLIGYWSLSEGRWQARGVGDKARDWALKKKLVSSHTPPVHALVNTLQTLWDKTMSELVHENKNFITVANEDCDYCPFSGICRVEEGMAS
jgi:ATP-dependent helicase/DNAse subunit B